MSEKSFVLAGEEVTVRSLTLKQIRAMKRVDEDEADVLCVLWATDLTRERAQEICETVPAGELLAFCAVVAEVSGLDEDARFQG